MDKHIVWSVDLDLTFKKSRIRYLPFRKKRNLTKIYGIRNLMPLIVGDRAEGPAEEQDEGAGHPRCLLPPSRGQDIRSQGENTKGYSFI